MRVVLVGADFEENLGVGMIAASAARAGHTVEIVPFNEACEGPQLARAVAQHHPEVVGLSMQFQHRAHEFIELARALRAHGFGGHITCGGQYPTLADLELLGHVQEIDSVVLHEGEHSFVELLDALGGARPLREVAGLALRDDDGAPFRTAGRRLVADLDSLPEPLRYRPHARHAGVPFIPIMGSRGCWGACTFCSITSFYRDARARAPRSKMLRQRSVGNIADEMARLWHGAEGRAGWSACTSAWRSPCRSSAMRAGTPTRP